MRRLFLFAGVFLVCASNAPAQNVVTGKVAETMDSGGYTYVRLVQGKDSAWAAIARQKVKVGDQLSLAAGVVMNNFHSKSLNRTFKKIIFSDGPVGPAAAGGMCPDEKLSPAAAPAKTAAKPMAHGAPAAQVLTVKSARAEGPDAFTVAEIFGRRKELAGKTVSVRGKVVKVSLEIMGRNWVHLQDGSGDPKAATHDLLATTSEEATVGETVTARGTVVKDKDFGSGYSYVVLLEKTAFKR